MAAPSIKQSLSPTVLLLISVFLFFYLTAATAAATSNTTATKNTTNALVTKTCKRASKESPNVQTSFCISALSVAESRWRVPASDLNDLALLSVLAAQANATATRARIKQLLKQGIYKDKYTKSSVDVCLSTYSDAVSLLMDSAKAIVKGRVEDARAWVSGAMTTASTCDTGFQEGGIKNLFKKEDKNLFRLCATSLAIISLLN